MFVIELTFGLNCPFLWQHIYLGALYGLLALKSVFLDDFNAYFSGSIGPYVLCLFQLLSVSYANHMLSRNINLVEKLRH